jgi:hypothetical protein
LRNLQKLFMRGTLPLFCLVVLIALSARPVHADTFNLVGNTYTSVGAEQGGVLDPVHSTPTTFHFDSGGLHSYFVIQQSRLHGDISGQSDAWFNTSSPGSTPFSDYQISVNGGSSLNLAQFLVPADKPVYDPVNHFYEDLFDFGPTADERSPVDVTFQSLISGNSGVNGENEFHIWAVTGPPAPVPEASTTLLFTLALAALGFGVLRKQRSTVTTT